VILFSRYPTVRRDTRASTWVAIRRERRTCRHARDPELIRWRESPNMASHLTRSALLSRNGDGCRAPRPSAAKFPISFDAQVHKPTKSTS